MRCDGNELHRLIVRDGHHPAHMVFVGAFDDTIEDVSLMVDGCFLDILVLSIVPWYKIHNVHEYHD